MLTSLLNSLYNKKMKELNNTSWQEKAILLINIQKNKTYKNQGFDNFTEFLNSLNKQKGNSRSNLIAIKSAGEFYLKITKSNNLEDIKKCKINDFKLLNLYKKN